MENALQAERKDREKAMEKALQEEREDRERAFEGARVEMRGLEERNAELARQLTVESHRHCEQFGEIIERAEDLEGWVLTQVCFITVYCLDCC